VVDEQEQYVIDQLEKQGKPKKKKKRGAPFKGQVSDHKEEGFKVQRQQTLRDFKSYYEKRSYLKRYPPQNTKKKKVFQNNEELEQV
jgi:hypothetical protein